MIINKRVEGDVAILELQGRMDSIAVDPMKSTVKEVMGDGIVKFLFDMKRVDVVDSAGLGTIVSLLRQINEVDGDLRLCDIPARVQSLLELTRMDRMLEIAPNAEEALVDY